MKKKKPVKVWKKWVINPRTRVKKSRKVYSRAQARRDLMVETRDESRRTRDEKGI